MHVTAYPPADTYRSRAQNAAANNVATSPRQNVLMAASLRVVLPVVILFVLLQRYFVNGPQGAVQG